MTMKPLDAARLKIADHYGISRSSVYRIYSENCQQMS
ncbi:MAG: hypothetical protein EOM12_16470 [Verrucomicrobiae bacterium]|nr:hypothetical protein [Verrucomicrobiae bacterium]